MKGINEKKGKSKKVPWDPLGKMFSLRAHWRIDCDKKKVNTEKSPSTNLPKMILNCIKMFQVQLY